MFSIIDEAKIREYPNKAQTVKTFVCLSDDDKPTEGIANGAQCIEMDTGKIYMFNLDDTEWVEVSISGGGGSGGGGSVPTPTAQDKGKGLTVGKATSSTPLFPTVSIPMDYDSVHSAWGGEVQISDTIPDWFVNGTKVFVELLGNTYEGSVISGEMGTYLEVTIGTDGAFGIYADDNDALKAWAEWYVDPDADSLDFTCYGEAIGWVIDPAPGYDAAVSIHTNNGSSYTGTIIKGCFAGLHALIENHIAPNILVRYWDNRSNEIKASSDVVAIYVINDELSVPVIIFSYKIPSYAHNSNYTQDWKFGHFHWYADDTLIC